MPEADGCIMLKLDTGYNLGIKKDKVEKIEVIESYASPIHEHKEHKTNPDLPTISVLHTGGTIASKVDYETGGVIARFDPEELLAMFPELKELCNIRSRLITQMWSEDMQLIHYNMLAQAVAEEFAKGSKGVIITHGTDTMHYSSAMLSYMMRNLPGPLLLVGAQRSSDRGSSDAAVNVISAAHFIAKADFSGVSVCMHDKQDDDGCAIIPGLYARKLHSSRRDAFQAVNTKPWARVMYPSGQINWMHKKHPKPQGEPKVQLLNDKLKVGMLYAHPGLSHHEITAYDGFDGLVLVGTGLGHFPINKIDEHTQENAKNLEAIKKMAEQMPLVMTTQTISGETNLNVYATGRKIKEAGIKGNGQLLTPETAWCKLVYLLSTGEADNYDSIRHPEELTTPKNVESFDYK